MSFKNEPTDDPILTILLEHKNSQTPVEIYYAKPGDSYSKRSITLHLRYFRKNSSPLINHAL